MNDGLGAQGPYSERHLASTMTEGGAEDGQWVPAVRETQVQVVGLPVPNCTHLAKISLCLSVERDCSSLTGLFSRLLC